MITTGKPIMGVAVVYRNMMWTRARPFRHHDILRDIVAWNGVGIREPDIQGFYDSEGKFLTREEAYIRAKETGQLKRDPDPSKYQGNKLFSEDLW